MTDVKSLVRAAVTRLNLAADGDPLACCRHVLDSGERPTLCLHHPAGVVRCPSCHIDHMAAEHDGRCDWCGNSGPTRPVPPVVLPVAGPRCYSDGTAEMGTLIGEVRLDGIARCERCERIAGLRFRLGADW